MHRTGRRLRPSKRLKGPKGPGTPAAGGPRLSGRATGRPCRKLQLWMWRKRRERYRFSIWSAKKRGMSSGLRLRAKRQSRPADAGAERDARRSSAHITAPRRPAVAPGLGVHGPGPRGQEKSGDVDADERTDGGTDLKVLAEDVHGFLDDFHGTYGSFIPLEKSDAPRRLRRRFDGDWKNVVLSEVAKYRTARLPEPVPSFRVAYKKHTLTLDDLSTLADHNWLNDQVMNMYGELIMDHAEGKVHFLNSFFHRQLVTKGYDGVKRWTKKVDLFSKRLLLVPVHLEVHWSLVAADNVQKRIRLYDSQGIALQKVARNILKYIMAEATDKKRTAFANGWAVSYNEEVPQQTNENDCGVFVLECSRRLALGKPLQFSQRDIPRIRKRIYKELCDRELRGPT